MSASMEWRDRVWASGGGLLAVVVAAAVLPATLLAQSPADEADGQGEQDAPAAIEWNFEPVPVTAPTPDLSLQEGWAAPFAVVSQGRISARERREVVVRAGATPPVGAGDSAVVVAVVIVEEGEEGRPGESASPEPVPDEDSDPPESAAAETPATPAAANGRAGSAGTAAADGARFHRVAFGETWFGLALEHGVSSAALAAANPEVDPERLRAGTVLRIPPSGTAAAAQRRTHTVARGDTLYGIARRYGVTAAVIRSANSLSGDVVRLGQTLVIPQEEDTDE